MVVKKIKKNKEVKKEEKSKTPEVFDFSSFGSIRSFLKENLKTEGYFGIAFKAKKHIEKIIKDSGLDKDYNFIFLIKESGMDKFDLDQIYQTISSFDNKENGLALIINSPGGSVEPAYLIAKCCQEYKGKFITIIPRRAKSAATLISLGAEEIHMGTVSELGPIDIQINRVPARALSNAVEYLASLQKKHPESYRMFSEYLSKELNLSKLGHFQRIAESMKDYAKILLKNNAGAKTLNHEEVAEKLVDGFQDHSFVIDDKQAKEILGSIIQTKTKEYDLGNKVYSFLDELSLAFWSVSKNNIKIEYTGNYLSITEEES